MSAKLKSVAANLALVIVSTLVGLAVGEVAVRLTGSQVIPKTHHKLFVEHDPLLGWRKIPNMTGIHGSDEYTVEESINSKGIRGPEYSYEKPSDEYRILVVGDSFAEGYTVDFEHLFSEILERNLIHPTKRVEVINAGTGGYSTDQEVLYFSNEGKKYAPDLTILLFYKNDVWYNGQPKYWRGFKPLFRFTDDGGLALTGVPVPMPEIVETDNKAIELSTMGQAKSWLRANLHSYRLVADSIKNSTVLTNLAVRVGAMAAPPNRGESEAPRAWHEEMDVFRTQLSDQWHDLWNMTEALLAKLHTDTEEAGSQLVIFYVPFRAAIYTEEWSGHLRRLQLAEHAWDPNQPGVQLRKICERQGLVCIDPTEPFLKSSERLYFVHDGHWNVAGNRLAGELLARHVAEHISR